MELITNTIGMQIKHYRTQKGISQEELAETVDVSPRHISSIETGAKVPSLSLLIDIANALGITTDDLLVDYLTGLSDSCSTEVIKLLSDCNTIEKTIILGMVKEMKRLFSENGI